MRPSPTAQSGFTLIEMSIVMVIIGLIVGGVLVVHDLIKAAEVRATVTQIEGYNRAVNTFYGKYGYFPGDIPATAAVQVGISPSVGARTWSGVNYGNGDGVLQSLVIASSVSGLPDGGENYLFWADLSATNLIAEAPTSCDIAGDGGNGYTGGCYFPAKLGQGNVIYVFSGFYNGGGPGGISNSTNYYGLSTALIPTGGGWSTSSPGLTVAQAYAIDAKMDDGLPQSGRVIAAYINANGNGGNFGAPVWVNPGSGSYSVIEWGITTAAVAGSSTTCYDNGGVGSATQKYSLEQNGGASVNCALSFQFQ
jgi:prepilin-type N-terminal cleavage/methylation domain-containing protein